MPLIIFDTCILIQRRPGIHVWNTALSAVVMQELLAGASDASAVKNYRKIYHQFLMEDKVLVPTAEDWWEAGKILNQLSRRNRSPKTGRIPKMQADQVHRIVRDVLIARSAKRAGALLVTDNVRDFESIIPYCAVKIKSGNSFFKMAQ